MYMPQNKFALARYSVINAMLRRNDYVKTSSLVKKCIESTGYKVSARTIQLDIEAMRYDPFLGYNAPISYNSRHKAYYYEDRSYMLYPFTFSPSELETLEEILKVCPTCIRFECHDTLCGITEKMKFHIG